MVQSDQAIFLRHLVQMQFFSSLLQMKLQGVEKNSGLGGKYANESLALLNKMLATPWFQTVNKCLLDTVDMEDLEDDELFGINAVEELLTDFLQLTHAVIRDVLPKGKGGHWTSTFPFMKENNVNSLMKGNKLFPTHSYKGIFLLM